VKWNGLSDSQTQLPLRVEGLVWRMGDENKPRASGLELSPGTITLLMGPNGAGKTTLLEKLAGLRPPGTLLVSYGPEPLWRKNGFGKLRLNEDALLQYSYACQSPEEGLFARSVREELDYSLRPYAISEVEQEGRRESSLRGVGWDPSWQTRDPYLMSGGERRRSALASVFVTPAPWLLLDEPTAGLDGAGHETVARQLMNRKASGTGILLVSHDSDWALPMADHALLLNAYDGSVRMCTREQLLMFPEWLEETGMTVPEWLETAILLWRNGVALDKVWNPLDAAAEMVKAMDLPSSEGKEFGIDDRGVWKKEENSKPARPVREAHIEIIKQHRLTGFDPRSVWLAYVLISTGLFFLSDWVSVGIGAFLVFALLTAGRISLRRWRGLIMNYTVFSVITSALFAWGASGGSLNFEWGAFAGTLRTFVRTMLVLLIGLAIPLVMTPLSLRRSLEQMIAIRGKTPQWAQRFILTVTLILRFIPVLLALWERFVRIFLARGKSTSGSPMALGRRLRDVSIPFLLALFRLGDEVALALESRGVGFHSNPTRATRLRWGKRDFGLAFGALALAIGLWVLAHR
jgi:energy-coupling factor transporter ATP-binding protein EcfA2/energy-coupling factor transporter transmembrane protein EcfT